MANEQGGDNPSTNPETEAFSISRDYNGTDSHCELAREFGLAEKWVIGTNIVLAVIGIFALCIYHGQLNVMRGLFRGKTSSPSTRTCPLQVPVSGKINGVTQISDSIPKALHS